MTKKDLQDLRAIIKEAFPDVPTKTGVPLSNEAIALQQFSNRLVKVIDNKISKRTRSASKEQNTHKPKQVDCVVEKRTDNNIND